jgi:hypothetical protein
MYNVYSAFLFLETIVNFGSTKKFTHEKIDT